MDTFRETLFFLRISWATAKHGISGGPDSILVYGIRKNAHAYLVKRTSRFGFALEDLEVSFYRFHY